MRLLLYRVDTTAVYIHTTGAAVVYSVHMIILTPVGSTGTSRRTICRHRGHFTSTALNDARGVSRCLHSCRDDGMHGGGIDAWGGGLSCLLCKKNKTEAPHLNSTRLRTALLILRGNIRMDTCTSTSKYLPQQQFPPTLSRHRLCFY